MYNLFLWWPVVLLAIAELTLKSMLFPVCQKEQAFGEQLSQEKGDLLVATEESRALIKALEEDIQILNQRSVEQVAELEK